MSRSSPLRPSQSRLVGPPLLLARALAEGPLCRRLLLPAFLADYRITELLALPADARATAELVPRPLPGAPPRRWPDQGLPAPDGPLARLHAAWRAGRSSPEQVLAALDARARAGDWGEAAHSPYVAHDPRARDQARASARRWAQGRPLGPLDGVPVPLKDEHDLVGLPTRGGTAYRTAPATADSHVARLLHAAGAVVHAKTHTTEWGMNAVGHSPHQALPRNVRDRERAAGGSSTGAAVAVALGLAPLAVGSDGGGSVRVPAALQGVFGLKPTFGLVGRSGDIFGSSSVSHVGPLAAGAAELAAFLDACAAAADPDDPTTAWHPDRAAAAAGWGPALGRGVRGARIGIPEGEWRDADPAVQQACQEAVRALQAEGARVVDVRIPHVDLAQAIGVAAIATESMGLLSDELAAHRGAMSDDLRLLLGIVGQLPARDYLAAARSRATLRRRLARIMAGLDLLALPTTPILAPPAPRAEQGRAVWDDPAARALCRYAFLANITGLPAGTAPIGLARGLPIGLQLIGDAWDEASVLAALAHLQRLGLTALPPAPGHAPLVS